MLLNLLPPTNLETVLKNTSVVNKTDESKLESLFEEHQIKKANTFTFDLLETDKIYHINAIKKVCVDYRLRFLDLKFLRLGVKNDIDLPKFAFF